jgi:hypothetical protein
LNAAVGEGFVIDHSHQKERKQWMQMRIFFDAIEQPAE